MLRLAVDADVRGGIVRGLRRRLPELDLVRANDAFPMGTLDPDVLAWAAKEGRVLLSNDRRTMRAFATERVAAGFPMPGVILTRNDQPIGAALKDLELIVKSIGPDEMRDRVLIFLPFRG